MAETLSSFEFPDKARKANTYPWAEWFDGRVWKLAPDDYKTKLASTFVAFAASTAKARGLKLRHHIDKATGAIVLQATQAPPADAATPATDTPADPAHVPEQPAAQPPEAPPTVTETPQDAKPRRRGK